MAVPSCVIRLASHSGTRPPWSGRSAWPERFTSEFAFGDHVGYYRQSSLKGRVREIGYDRSGAVSEILGALPGAVDAAAAADRVENAGEAGMIVGTLRQNGLDKSTL